MAVINDSNGIATLLYKDKFYVQESCEFDLIG